MKTRAEEESSGENAAAESCLNLQPVYWRRQNGKARHFSTDHWHFIAVMKTRTFVAVFVYLVGQVLVRSNGEPHAREEIRNAREQADAGNTVPFRLCEQSFHQA